MTNFIFLFRILGALLSAHLLIQDKKQPFGQLEPDWYDGELLEMASDLASRLIPAFQNSKTGLPHPRVSFLFILSSIYLSSFEINISIYLLFIKTLVNLLLS